MTTPHGELVRSRVVSDPATALATALERGLTGRAVFRPQDSLLLDGDGYGVLTLEDGVPVAAHHTGTGRGGPEAVADLATPGPYSVELYRYSPDEHETAHEQDERAIPPGMPAERQPATRSWPRKRGTECRNDRLPNRTRPRPAPWKRSSKTRRRLRPFGSGRKPRPNGGPRSGDWTTN